jgi:ribulose 1,5-bisphosphate carboxylase large subunit-like protein
MKFYREQVNVNDYVVATYEMGSKTSLRDAAWNLAIGQSVGNPNVRNAWETDELFERNSCIIIGDEKELESKTEGIVKIAFPVVNTDWDNDGISHLMCQLMGGQMDIDIITKCRLVDISFPKCVEDKFLGPKYGITGMREFTGQHDKPLFGSIIKPKIGLSPEQLLDMTKQLVDGGVDFIKEDEILSNPAFCSLEDRTELITDYINNCGRNIVYSFCVNSDPHDILNRVKFVHENGGNGVHLNVWCGLGAYNSVRKLDLPINIHFQKSGDKVFTDSTHRFGVDWNVVCDIAGLVGVDTIHSGMWGGYKSDDEEDLKITLKVLRDRNVVPALSCGMKAELIKPINEKFGIDYMANVGGAIHGDTDGTTAGALKIRKAIENEMCYSS